jgi:hypothetical protein
MTRVYVGAGVAVGDWVAAARKVRVGVGDDATAASSGKPFAKASAAKVKPVNSQQTHTKRITRIPIWTAEKRAFI